MIGTRATSQKSTDVHSEMSVLFLLPRRYFAQQYADLARLAPDKDVAVNVLERVSSLKVDVEHAEDIRAAHEKWE